MKDVGKLGKLWHLFTSGRRNLLWLLTSWRPSLVVEGLRGMFSRPLMQVDLVKKSIINLTSVISDPYNLGA